MPPTPIAALTLSAAALALGGCAGEDGQGDSRTQPYSGIAQSEVIELTGTEPFWGMTIDPTETPGADMASSGSADAVAAYSTPENIDGTRFALERFAGNNGIGFTGTLDGGEKVTVTITPGDCSDGMSDRTYPFTATARIGERRLKGCAYTDAQGFEGPRAP